MSDIRNLLARAQEYENQGRRADAAEWLRKAATWYRDHDQLRRAAQMLRQARRVEGIEEEETASLSLPQGGEGQSPDAVFGFGDDFEADVKKVLIEQRTPQLADPSLAAWCSFCCKPKEEVGQLVAGPAGAFICASCTSISGELRGLPHPNPSPVRRGEVELVALGFELPSQRRARERFMRLRPKLALVIGPSGSGKTAWIQSIAHAELQVIDATRALSSPLDENRNIVLVVTAEIPPPALVLQGEHGEEPIHDTASLSAALPHLPAHLASRIDAVHAFETPSNDALRELARHLADKRGLTLSDEALGQLVSLAARAKNGAHELVTVLARIPPGRYS